LHTPSLKTQTLIISYLVEVVLATIKAKPRATNTVPGGFSLSFFHAGTNTDAMPVIAAFDQSPGV
jgi:hypothetical protein